MSAVTDVLFERKKKKKKKEKSNKNFPPSNTFFHFDFEGQCRSSFSSFSLNIFVSVMISDVEFAS